MPNIGTFPLDPTSPVGQLRVLTGDTASTPLVPEVPGQENYAIWSDLALEASFALAGESVYRAAGDLYSQLAATYAQSSKSIKTDDLAIDTTKRGGSFLDIARSFYARADALDEAEANDFFEIVPFGGARPEAYRVEGSPWPLPSSPAAPATADGMYGNEGYGDGG